MGKTDAHRQKKWRETKEEKLREEQLRDLS